MSAWLADSRQRVLQLLPLNEMAPGQHSPYSAISAMAIDPIFVRLQDVPEFESTGGEAALGPGVVGQLTDARRAPRVEYAAIRPLKQRALRAAFDRFYETSWRAEDARARMLKTFLDDQAWWIDDYTLFRALHSRESDRPWLEWPIELRERRQAALDEARRQLSREILYYGYIQWLAAEQLTRARAAARQRGVAIFGDLPFMVDGDSADVWARQHQFRLDAAAGAPPDAFSATGQDWGLPVYRWDVMATDGFSWLRDRARRSAAIYDGYRIDHLVGLYRTYAKPRDGAAPFFTPSEPREQLALGEHTLDIFAGSGAEIIAEDLGTVPDFVRESLARKGVPGFCVMRWERYWKIDGQPFRDPVDYPARSVAASGTHDTEPVAVWWDRASNEERRAVGALPTVQQLNGQGLDASPFNHTVRDTLLEALFASGSDLLLLTAQDIFGWRERINEPATVTDENWTFRLPWPSDRLGEVPEARERSLALRTWAERYGR
jgi:4-alpha-glucanotransferase